MYIRFDGADATYAATGDDGRGRMWVPVLDGVERLGVLELDFDPDHAPRSYDAASFAGLVAEVVMAKEAYGDSFERVRRRRPMSIAAELAWRLLPPLTFGTDRLVISGVVAPVYELGGDSFDYSVDTDTAHVSIFDAMGHGLEAELQDDATIVVVEWRGPGAQLLEA